MRLLRSLKIMGGWRGGARRACSHQDQSNRNRAFFVLFTNQRLKMRRGPSGSLADGNLKDDHTAIYEVEKTCDWLMDSVACPTTWQPLLAIRNETAHDGVAQPTVA
jgi:hypothetical protein